MPFKFEQLEVWQLSLEYVDQCYSVAQSLPKSEERNLSDQLRRAATSIALNIAEGSTGMSDAEQVKFLGYAIRSTIETIACIHFIRRRNYIRDLEPLREAYRQGDRLVAKLQAFRNHIAPSSRWQVREDDSPYDTLPF